MRDDTIIARGLDGRPEDRATGFAGVAVFTADWDVEPVRAQLAAPAEPRAEAFPHAPAVPERSGPGWLGLGGALAWIGVSVGSPLAYFGPEALFAQHPALLAALGAGAVFPAAMILVAATAARAAARARDEARRLAVLTAEAMTPSQAPSQALATVGRAVRGEIVEIEQAVEAALSRLGALEQSTLRNRQALARVLEEAEVGAKTLTAVFDREIAAADRLNASLRDQTEQMGQSVGRQIRLMREASRLVNEEVASAERAFGATFEAFTQVGGQLADRTGQLAEATAIARDATSALDQTMGRTLDSLSQATTLTDASRQSVEAAAAVANETAAVLKDAGQRAVAEARRAAQAIRAETAAMQEQAAETLAKLQEAAAEARAASESASATAERQAAALRTRKPAAPPRQAADPLFAGGWGRSFAKREAAPAPARRPSIADVLTEAPARRRLEGPFDILEAAGVAIDQVLPEADLERISVRARLGQAARRRAVMEMAPEAVTRLCNHFESDAEALAEAQAFRRAPNLPEDAGRRQSPEGDRVAAYLLIDAALG